MNTGSLFVFFLIVGALALPAAVKAADAGETPPSSPAAAASSCRSPSAGDQNLSAGGGQKPECSNLKQQLEAAKKQAEAGGCNEITIAQLTRQYIEAKKKERINRQQSFAHSERINILDGDIEQANARANNSSFADPMTGFGGDPEGLRQAIEELKRLKEQRQTLDERRQALDQDSEEQKRTMEQISEKLRQSETQCKEAAQKYADFCKQRHECGVDSCTANTLAKTEEFNRTSQQIQAEIANGQGGAQGTIRSCSLQQAAQDLTGPPVDCSMGDYQAKLAQAKRLDRQTENLECARAACSKNLEEAGQYCSLARSYLRIISSVRSDDPDAPPENARIAAAGDQQQPRLAQIDSARESFDGEQRKIVGDMIASNRQMATAERASAYSFSIYSGGDTSTSTPAASLGSGGSTGGSSTPTNTAAKPSSTSTEKSTTPANNGNAETNANASNTGAPTPTPTTTAGGGSSTSTNATSTITAARTTTPMTAGGQGYYSGGEPWGNTGSGNREAAPSTATAGAETPPSNQTSETSQLPTASHEGGVQPAAVAGGGLAPTGNQGTPETTASAETVSRTPARVSSSSSGGGGGGGKRYSGRAFIRRADGTMMTLEEYKDRLARGEQMPDVDLRQFLPKMEADAVAGNDAAQTAALGGKHEKLFQMVNERYNSLDNPLDPDLPAPGKTK